MAWLRVLCMALTHPLTRRDSSRFNISSSYKRGYFKANRPQSRNVRDTIDQAVNKQTESGARPCKQGGTEEEGPSRA